MRTSAGTSPSLVGPTSGCSSSPSTISSAHFMRYSCARWTGLRVWKPTTVAQPRSAKAARVSAGVRARAPTGPSSGSTTAWTGPATARVGAAQHAGHAGVVGVGGAVDQLGLGPAVALEHLGDLEHAEQLAPLAPEGEAAGVDPDPVGDAEADRDRPQGAVGQAHRLGDRLVLLGPHEAGQRAVGAGGQGAQVGRLGRGQRQRGQRARRQDVRLVGVEAPVDELAAVRQAAARSGQRLLADRHGGSSFWFALDGWVSGPARRRRRSARAPSNAAWRRWPPRAWSACRASRGCSGCGCGRCAG